MLGFKNTLHAYSFCFKSARPVSVFSFCLVLVSDPVQQNWNTVLLFECLWWKTFTVIFGQGSTLRYLHFFLGRVWVGLFRLMRQFSPTFLLQPAFCQQLFGLLHQHTCLPHPPLSGPIASSLILRRPYCFAHEQQRPDRSMAKAAFRRCLKRPALKEKRYVSCV